MTPAELGPHHFSIAVRLKIGERSTFDVRDWVMTCGFVPETFITNIPWPGFIKLQAVDIDIFNVLVTRQGLEKLGWSDAATHRNGTSLKPHYAMTRGAHIAGAYSGLVPPELKSPLFGKNNLLRVSPRGFTATFSFIGAVRRDGVDDE